jgi:phage replication initiation protein
MGAQNTTAPAIPSENRVLFDWVSFTLKNPCPDNAARLLHLDLRAFTELEYGGMGYKKSFRFGNITILTDGNDGMGCHVSLSGQGCRQFEGLGTHKDWRSLFACVKATGGTFTRLDIAFDTVDGSLPINKIWEAVKNGQTRSQFGKSRKIESVNMGGQQTDGGTSIYFGAASSRVQFRVYDKAKEQGLDGQWVRFELQLRKQRADVTAEYFLICDDAGMIGTGIINKFLTFINRDDSNKSRCSVQSWWASWLQHTEKLKLTVAAAKKQVADLMNHIQKQYSATLATISEYLDFTGFQNFIALTVKHGVKRMSKRHQMILQASFGPDLCADLPF